MSTLSGLNFSLWRERECDRPRDMVEMSEGVNPGINAVRCSRIARYRSWVLESDIMVNDRPGSLLMAIPISSCQNYRNKLRFCGLK